MEQDSEDIQKEFKALERDLNSLENKLRIKNETLKKENASKFVRKFNKDRLIKEKAVQEKMSYQENELLNEIQTLDQQRKEMIEMFNKEKRDVIKNKFDIFLL